MPEEKNAAANTTVSASGNQNAIAGHDFTGNTLNYGGVVININVQDSDTTPDIARQISQAIQQLAPSLPPSIITDQQRAELLVLLRQVKLADADWLKLYQGSLPDGAKALVAPKTPLEILTELGRFPPQEAANRLPTFTFVEQLAQKSNADLQQALRAWMEQTRQSQGWQLNLDAMGKALQMAAKQNLPAVAHLLVELIPDDNNRNVTKQKKYKVEITLWPDASNQPILWYTSEQQTLTLEEIETQLDALLADAQKVSQIPRDATLAFEFFMPFDLLCYSIEQWKRQKARPIGATYGMRYWVAVRLRDRLTIEDPAERREILRMWRVKWRHFQQCAQQADFSPMHWLSDQDEKDPFQLSLRLQDEEETVCLSLASMPPVDDLFNVLIDGGIPVALWLRQSVALPPDTTLQTTITPLFTGSTLAELPRLVQSWRRKVAATDKNHPVNYLTLLWDDPKRIPPAYLAEGEFSDDHLAGV